MTLIIEHPIWTILVIVIIAGFSILSSLYCKAWRVFPWNDGNQPSFWKVVMIQFVIAAIGVTIIVSQLFNS
ncbi:hypothetical protein YK48G_14960 [Lentilactobacillus fungorum]|uniref:Uncharacterized protein n=2 Tax=Lentilactobacillus fungorum TaxID=2201250 RepID=A0ABQ3W0T3_9LACO|nr:hypothetical protein YK48G_14960 [Lentilactobacillus fungorum]